MFGVLALNQLADVLVTLSPTELGVEEYLTETRKGRVGPLIRNCRTLRSRPVEGRDSNTASHDGSAKEIGTSSEKHAEAPWGYFRLVRNGTWHIYHDPYRVLADEPALASLHGPDAEANGQRIVYCVNACKGIPTVCLGAGLENAVLGDLVGTCRVVDLNAQGRSGGAIYMINRQEFLHFRKALHNLKPQEIRP